MSTCFAHSRRRSPAGQAENPPRRGAPTIANDTVYTLSQDSQIFALNAQNGEQRWTGAGSFELAGVFGSAAPAFAQSTLVAGFSSGELTAYRYENGQVMAGPDCKFAPGCQNISTQSLAIFQRLGDDRLEQAHTPPRGTPRDSGHRRSP